MASKNTASGGGGVFGAVAKAIALLLCLALLGGVIWFAVATDGFTNFNRITGGDRVMTQKTTGVRFLAGERTEFTVQNLNFTGSAPSYKAEVHFNGEEPFDFEMNGDGKSYTTRGEEADLADYFGVEKTESGFAVTPPHEYSEEHLLAWLYPEADGIAVTSEAVDADLYVLTVTFSDGNVYNIYFNVDILRLSLDQSEIIFSGEGGVNDPEQSGGDETTEPPEEGQETEKPDDEEPPQKKYEITYDYTQGGGGAGTSWSIVPSITEAAPGEVTIRFIVSHGVSIGEIGLYATVSGTEQTLTPEQVSNSEYSLTFTMPAEEIALTVKFIME